MALFWLFIPAGMQDTIQTHFGSIMPYLLKTEPNEYSFERLQTDSETLWDGVTNPVALKNLRAMKAGDKLVIYHTGDERRAVGTAKVKRVEVSDSTAPSVWIAVGHPIGKPKSLAEIKNSALFSSSPLVKQGRLSVVPLDELQYNWLVGESS
jgi:predicted RNA-binding protein with PUA-like domain